MKKPIKKSNFRKTNKNAEKSNQQKPQGNHNQSMNRTSMDGTNRQNRKDDARYDVLVTKKKPKSRAVLYFALGMLVLLFVVALNTKIKTTNYVIKEPLTGVRQEIERLPYEDYETYYITEEYEDKVPFGTKDCKSRQMNFNITFDNPKILSEKNITCSLTITNFENVGGEWEYSSQIIGDLTNIYNYPKKIWVPANSQSSEKWDFEVNEPVGSLRCNYLQQKLPSMIKCFYAEPISYQTVKKTRIVEKNRTIIKYREITTITNQTTYQTTNKKLTTITFFGHELVRIG